MTKIIPIKKGKAKKQAVRTVVPGRHLKLPPQDMNEIQLVDTDTQLLLNLAQPNDFRNLVMALKVKFVKDIQSLAAACDLEVDTKIYFTFNTKE